VQAQKEKYLESYVVNIYRREREANMIVGVVEKVGSEGKQAFQTSEGLLALLRADGGQDRRREGRLRLKIPLFVEGISEEGQYFRERTTLTDLSPHGARYSMKTRTIKGQAVLLLIDPDHTALEITAHIVRVVDRAEGRETAVSF